MNISVEYEWIFMLKLNEYFCRIWMNIVVEVEWIFLLNMNEYFCWSWMNIFLEYEYFSWTWINLLKLNEYFSWIWMQTLEVEQIFSVEFWKKIANHSDLLYSFPTDKAFYTPMITDNGNPRFLLIL
jgi:hypothetical protein